MMDARVSINNDSHMNDFHVDRHVNDVKMSISRRGSGAVAINLLKQSTDMARVTNITVTMDINETIMLIQKLESTLNSFRTVRT